MDEREMREALMSNLEHAIIYKYDCDIEIIDDGVDRIETHSFEFCLSNDTTMNKYEAIIHVDTVDDIRVVGDIDVSFVKVTDKRLTTKTHLDVSGPTMKRQIVKNLYNKVITI